MRAVLASLAVMLSAVFLTPGCDRLPARGGEGEPCFGNDSCGGELVCEGGVCVASCAPSCDGKNCGESDGCGGTCGACPSGQWCDGTDCIVCDTAEHCGESCTGCSLNTRGEACVDVGGFQCGCRTDDNCVGDRYCDLATHGCLDCNADDNCGLGCVDCSQQATNSQCVGEGGLEDLHCGCENETQCAAGEECDPTSMTCGACQPTCEGKQCGQDGCGSECPPGCDAGVTTCDADNQCVGCDNDCTSIPCGSLNDCGQECDGAGEICGVGTWCETDGQCSACESDLHCGDACLNCTNELNGTHCLVAETPPYCGCRDDQDCPDNRICQGDLCESCTPDCIGKCGGVDDGCGNPCGDECLNGQCCQSGLCVSNQDPLHCGPLSTCTDCSVQATNKGCVDLDGVSFGCGCDVDNVDGHCDAGEQCVGTQCQAGADPTPTSTLDLTAATCSVTALALSGGYADHEDKIALLVGCETSPHERLWLMENGVLDAGPLRTWADLDGGPLTAHFEPESYSIMVTDSNGNWLYRKQFSTTWEDPDNLGQGEDGGMGYGGATHAVWSIDGTYIMAAHDMGGGYDDWRLVDGDLSSGEATVIWALTSSGSFTGLAFLADTSRGVAVFSQGGMATFDVPAAASETMPMDGVDYTDLAVPFNHNTEVEMATLSNEGSPPKIRVWEGVSSGSPSSMLSENTEAESIAFLPGASSGPSRFVLVGTSEGEIRAFKFVPAGPGMTPDRLAVTVCSGQPITSMALSPDGDWLAAACGDFVTVWDVARLRTFFDHE